MNHIGQRIEADLAVSISDLKRNPAAVMKAAELQAVAVLSHNRVVGYVISPEAWDGILESLDDLRSIELAEERRGQKGIEVSLDDLQGDI